MKKHQLPICKLTIIDTKYLFLNNLINIRFLNKNIILEEVKNNVIAKPDTIATKNNKNFYTYKLTEMKIINELEEDILGLKIAKSRTSKMNYIEFSEYYIRFIKSINSEYCIHNFDLHAFKAIFENTYVDKYIHGVILKLIADPFLYEKDEKPIINIILRQAYQYCTINKLDIYKPKLKPKIMKFPVNKKLDNSGFNYLIINDPFFDLYSIRSPRKKNLYEEAIFMNDYYKYYQKTSTFDYSTFEPWLKRFVENIDAMDAEYISDFLKICFLNKSVLYNITTENEAYKLIFCVLKNKKGIKPLHLKYFFRFIDIVLFKNRVCSEVYRLLSVEYYTLTHICDDIKNEKITLIMRNIQEFNDIINIFNDNAESFLTIQIIMKEYKKYTENFVYIKSLDTLFNVFDSCLKIIKNMKQDFILQLDMDFLRILKILCDQIKKSLVLKNEEYKLDHQNIICENLSNFILLLQSKQDINSKKKKKLTVPVKSESEISRFIDCIRQIEALIGNKMLLKDRSFKINPQKK